MGIVVSATMPFVETGNRKRNRITGVEFTLDMLILIILGAGKKKHLVGG